MAVERIDSILNMPAIEAEFNALKAGLVDSQKGLTQLYDLIKSFKDTTISNLAANSEKLGQAINGTVDRTAKAAAAFESLTQKIAAQTAAVRDGIVASAGQSAAYDQLIKQAVRNKIAQQELAQSAKEVKAAYDRGETTIDQYTASLESIQEAQHRLKISNQDITKGLNNMEKQAQSSGTSIDGLKAKLNLLTQAYDKLSEEERKSESGQSLLKNIQETDAAYKKLKEDTGRFQDSVGNYKGAFKEAFEVLKKELQQVNQEMGNLEKKGATVVNNLTGGGKIGFDPNRHKGDVTNFTKAGGDSVNIAAGDAAAYGQLSQKHELLNKLVQQTTIGFKTSRQESRAFQEAAVQLGLSVGQTDEKFLEFNKAVGEAQNGINDLKAAAKFQAQDAKFFVGLVSAVNGLVGAFGAAQAAAGLFSDESEESQKQMQKLQQLLVLITGLQQIANTVQEESGAVQLVLAARMNLTNAARRVQTLLTTQAIAVVTADTAANEANAISQEQMAAGAGEAAVALEAEAAATTEAAVATTGLSTALIATGIGAIILAIGAAIVYLVSKIPGWLQGSKLTIKQQEELADALKGANQAIIDQTEFIDRLDQSTQNYYKNQLGLSQAAGQNQYRQFALEMELAKAQKESAQERIKDLGATNAQQSELASTIQNLTSQQTEYYNILRKLNAIPKKDLTKDQEREITGAQNNLNLLQKRIDAIKGLYDAGDKARQDSFAADQKMGQLDLQLQKFTSDEERKIEFESAKARIELVKDRNQRILNDDASTLKQRLSALRELRDQEKASAQNDYNNVANDPNATVRQVEVAQIQLNAARAKAEGDYQEKTQKLRREYYERDRDARFEIYKTSVDESLKYEQEILSKKVGSEPDQVGGDQKVQALSRQLELNKQLIEQERQRELDQEKFKANDKATNDEKLAINRKYDSQLRQLDESYLKDQRALNIEIRDATIADWDKYYEARDIQLDEETNHELDALNERLSKKRISEDKYNAERTRIEDESLVKSLELQVQNDYLKVQSYEKGTKARLDAEKKLQEDLRRLNDARKKQQQDEISEELASLRKTFQEIDSESKNYAQATIDLLDIGYNKRKAQIEELEASQQKAYENEASNIRNSTANEEQKAIRLKLLESQRQTQKDANDRKQRQADIQKAQFDKARDILGIITGTALAVVKALPNVALAISVGALGAAELVAAIATPLPHYAKGTEDHPGGDAVVGDAYKSELILEPGKSPRWSASVPTVESLLPHTKVIPPEEINRWIHSGMMVNQQGVLVMANDNKKELREIKEAIVWQTQRFEAASARNKSRTVIQNRIDTTWGQYIQNEVFR